MRRAARRPASGAAGAQLKWSLPGGIVKRDGANEAAAHGDGRRGRSDVSCSRDRTSPSSLRRAGTVDGPPPTRGKPGAACWPASCISPSRSRGSLTPGATYHGREEKIEQVEDPPLRQEREQDR